MPPATPGELAAAAAAIRTAKAQIDALIEQFSNGQTSAQNALKGLENARERLAEARKNLNDLAEQA